MGALAPLLSAALKKRVSPINMEQDRIDASTMAEFPSLFTFHSDLNSPKRAKYVERHYPYNNRFRRH